MLLESDEMRALLSRGLQQKEYEPKELEQMLLYLFVTYSIVSMEEFCSISPYQNIVDHHFHYLTDEQKLLLARDAQYVLKMNGSTLTDIIKLPYSNSEFELILTIGELAVFVGIDFDELFDRAKNLIAEHTQIDAVVEAMLADIDI